MRSANLGKEKDRPNNSRPVEIFKLVILRAAKRPTPRKLTTLRPLTYPSRSLFRQGKDLDQDAGD